MSRSPGGVIAPAWTLLGVAVLFSSAVWRLGGRGVATLQDGLSPGHWLLVVLLTIVMVYGEGVVALQRRWVPRLIRRAWAIRSESLIFKLLGPFYGLYLVGAPAKQLLRGWLGTAAIVTAILIVRSFADPWRGIVDFAVAAALTWGLFSIVAGSPAAFRSTEPEPPAEAESGRGDRGGQARSPKEVDGDHDPGEVLEEGHAGQVEGGVREESQERA